MYRSSQNPMILTDKNIVNVTTVVFDLTQINPQNGMMNTNRPTVMASGRQSPANRQNTKLVSSRRFPYQITNSWLYIRYAQKTENPNTNLPRSWNWLRPMIDSKPIFLRQ